MTATRADFPVLDRVAYLNAGSVGPRTIVHVKTLPRPLTRCHEYSRERQLGQIGRG